MFRHPLFKPKIAFTVDKDCKCGANCLQKLKLGPYNYDLAAEVLGQARLKVHQNGLASKAVQKQNLKKAFEGTIKGTCTLN